MLNKNLSIILLPFFLLLLAPSPLPAVDAIRYTVTNNAPNTPGGKIFDQQIGVNFTLQIMKTINNFIYKVFDEPTPQDRRNVPQLDVYISDFDEAWAYTNGQFGNSINVSVQAIEKYFLPRDKVKFIFTSLMYHEMTHIFQWSGNFTAPGGLTEGMADYVRVKSGVYDKDAYTKPGEGEKWDDGYGVTERFLEYGDSLRNGFTAALNKKMRYKYNDHYFVELLGKSVDELWKEYKAKYGNINTNSLQEPSKPSKNASMFYGAKY